MKTVCISIVLVTFFIACGGDAAKQETKTPQETKTTADNAEKKADPDVSNNPDYKAGLALIAGSDCFTCHKIDEKLVGPAYRDVANKYANAGDTVVNYLAGKIIQGGAGVWGEVMMTPHPGLPEADAQAMAKYVLLLKR
jgi:cytochrome c